MNSNKILKVFTASLFVVCGTIENASSSTNENDPSSDPSGNGRTVSVTVLRSQFEKWASRHSLEVNVPPQNTVTNTNHIPLYHQDDNSDSENSSNDPVFDNTVTNIPVVANVTNDPVFDNTVTNIPVVANVTNDPVDSKKKKPSFPKLSFVGKSKKKAKNKAARKALFNAPRKFLDSEDPKMQALAALLFQESEAEGPSVPTQEQNGGGPVTAFPGEENSASDSSTLGNTTNDPDSGSSTSSNITNDPDSANSKSPKKEKKYRKSFKKISGLLNGSKKKTTSPREEKSKSDILDLASKFFESGNKNEQDLLELLLSNISAPEEDGNANESSDKE